MIDLDENDLQDIHAPVPLNGRIPNDDLSISQNSPIVISYALVDLEKTAYHFKQSFTLRDTQTYFKILKELSSSSIHDWLEDGRKYHFYRTDIKGNLKSLLNQLSPGAADANPLVFHFALYTDKNTTADRKQDIRAPRIYFMLGRYGIIYILFFDPYHEINPIAARP